MERTITVAASAEWERLQSYLLADEGATPTVPMVRGWVDGLLLAYARQQGLIDTVASARVGSAVFLPQPEATDEARTLSVDVDLCFVAPRGGLARLHSPAAWRNLKIALTDGGWSQDLVEELISPTTSSGAIGAADPWGVAEFILALKSELVADLLRLCDADFRRYVHGSDLLATASANDGIEFVVPLAAVRS